MRTSRLCSVIVQLLSSVCTEDIFEDPDRECRTLLQLEEVVEDRTDRNVRMHPYLRKDLRLVRAIKA